MIIDWQRVVLNLKHAGFSCAWISRKISLDAGYVQRLANGTGSEPRFSDGLNLHHDLCEEKHTPEYLVAQRPKRPQLKLVGER